MSETLENTVETSNSTGMVKTNDNDFFVSNYSRSFVDEEVLQLGNKIKQLFDEAGAKTEVIMSAPAWQSDLSSPFLKLAEDTFVDVLHFMPRKVAMHFALEAGYYVRKFPGCEIVSIGPKIIEPHSVTERVDIHTIQNIWKVLIEMLARLANEKA
jgi:dipeptidase D